MADARQGGLGWTIARLAAFGLPAGIYLYLWANPHLNAGAHRAFPVFSTHPRYLHDALSAPGGLIGYVGALLAQSWYSEWLGAVVVAALLTLLAAGLDCVIARMEAPQLRVLAFVPPALCISAYGQGHPQLTPIVALLLAVAASCAVMRPRNQRVRMGVFAVTAVVIYYVAGGAFVVLGLIAALNELFVRRSTLPALVCLLAIEAIPCGAFTWVLDATFTDAALVGLPWHPDAMYAGVGLLPLAVISVIIITLLGGIVAALARRAKAKREAAGVTRPPAPRRRRLWLRVAGTAAVPVMLALAIRVTHDEPRQRALRISHAVGNGQWAEVLYEAQQIRGEDLDAVVCHQVNRALYEMGRLPYDMFAWPQSPTSLMVGMSDPAPKEERERAVGSRTEMWFETGDVDLALGLVNEAEREAHEALAAWGEHPRVLLALAFISAVKGQSDAARRFLSALSHDLVHRAQAHQLLRELDADPQLSGHPGITRWRSIMPVEDELGVSRDITGRCRRLLARNPRNRMAFEYLMAAHLLRGDLAAFAGELHRLDDFDYPGIPRHYEEAALLYEAETGKPPETGERELSEEGRRRFARFRAAAASVSPDPRPLIEEFGGSYLLYYTLGVRGEPGQ